MKQVVKIILATAAVVALAVPAMAADKLIVKNSTGTANVFAVSDTGGIVVNGGLVWDSVNKRLGMNTPTPSASLHAMETSSTNPVRGIMSAQHNDGAQGALIQFKKSRGTESVPTAVNAGDYIGFFDTLVADGTAGTPVFVNPAGFGFVAESAATAGSVPTAAVFFTGYKGATGRKERFRVASDGRLRFSNGPAAPANNATCTVGELIVDAPNGFLYLCTATNSWKRASFAAY